MGYDVIVAGASFAGLAVARELNGRVLLVDRVRIGQGVTSACVTLVPVLEECQAEASIKQRFDEAVIHVSGKEYIFPLDPQFASFDYEVFCQEMYKQVDVEFLSATIKGIDEEDRVVTDVGFLEAPILVDCTGWKRALAKNSDTKRSVRQKLSFGFETVVDYQDSRMHMVFDPRKLGRGYGWVFPCGERTRFGLCTYGRDKRIDAEFTQFLADYDVEKKGLHGGYFTHRLGSPMYDQIFMVGDSAGMCFPATGEGIRQAIFFGKECGKIIREVQDGILTMDGARDRYKAFVSERAGFYKVLNMLQGFLVSVHPLLATRATGIIHKRFDLFMRPYLGLTGIEKR